MTVTSGFFNSQNGDRKYNAEQMSAIFDGIIRDGVFANIGTAFAVKAATGKDVTIGIGRAWFNSTWVYNDAILSITADDAEVLLDRYDAVVFDIDHTDNVRAGNIKIIKGTPASEPKYPTMANSEDVHQYPLCYILRKAGSTVITQAEITNMIGTSSCPYVTGILEVVNIDNIVAQWQEQWKQWTGEQQSDFSSWRSKEQEKWEQWSEGQQSDFSSWRSEEQENFEAWMDAIRGVLAEDAAASLSARIVALESYKQVTLPAAGWSAEAPYTQTVGVSGMKETDQPIPLFVDDGSTEQDSKSRKKAYSCITQFDSGEAQMTVTCKYKKPATDCTIALKGV